MNRTLYLIRNILFLIVITFLIIYFVDMPSINPIFASLVYLFSLILVILLIKQYSKKDNNINFNKQYNITFIISMIYILIVIGRNLLDNYIVIKVTTDGLHDFTYFNNIFFGNDCFFITFILFGLLFYNFLLIRLNE
ncbi:MAG: hypothetical protein ACOXZR_03130 [Bacilli bacterium]|jgi:hypothetical protein